MAGCVGCRWAEWDRTKTGRLSPRGDGRCLYPVVLPVLPLSRSWLSGRSPTPLGGWIVRQPGHGDGCPCRSEPEDGGDVHVGRQDGKGGR
jgi:hypothetical protein